MSVEPGGGKFRYEAHRTGDTSGLLDQLIREVLSPDFLLDVSINPARPPNTADPCLKDILVDCGRLTRQLDH